MNAVDAPAALEFDLWVFYNETPSNPSDVSFFRMSVDGIASSVVSVSSSLVSSCALNHTDAGGVLIRAFYKFHVRMLWTTVFRTDTRIKIISNMNVASNVSSFGFRNMQYYLDGSIPTSGPIIAANFPCASGSYWNGSACVACYNAFCGTCTGPIQANCTSCKDGAFDYGNFNCSGTCYSPFRAVTTNGFPYLCEEACTATDFFWFYNQSCSTTCHSPFSSANDTNGLQICSNPCYYNDTNSSYVGKYMYPDQTCLSTCPSPLEMKTPGLCVSPCTNTSHFVFTNGTCKSNCPALLVNSTVNSIKYCKSPCPNQYIYADTTCSSSCSSPLIARNDSADIKFCESPCANSSDFLFTNGSCKSSCPAPLVQSTSHSIYFCKSPCPGQYIYGDGSCSTECAPPLIAVDESADIKWCRSPCPNVNDYIFRNGSCTSQCVIPLLESTLGGYNLCNSPCPGQYIYIDGTCSLDCDAPLVRFDESDIKYCRSPCADVTAFIFNNGSCTSQCASPLVKSTVKGNKFCNSPCPNQFIYTDGTCSTSCASPLLTVSESEIKWCRNPCADVSYYIFTNGSCESSCNPLLMKSTVKGNNFCKSPCPGKYIYYDGACQTDCAAPMVKRDESADVKFCVSPCKNSQEFYYEADQVCMSTCETPYEPRKVYNMNLCYISVPMKVGEVQSTKDMVSGITGANQAGATGGKASVSMSSTSPALAFMAGQVSLLFSIRYINVNYPNRLKLMFKLQGASPFSFSLDFKIPPGVQKDLGKKTLPDIFEEYEVPADFLENFWDSLLTLLLTLVLILMVSMMERVFVRKCPIIGLILGSLLRMMKWNLPLMILCSAFGDLFFFASLQFQSKGSGNTLWEIVSLVLAIFMMIVGVMIVILPFKIVKEIQDSERVAEKKWRNFELLYNGNKRNSTLSFCYMAIFLSITVVSNLVITTLYASPLFEAFFITGLSVIMLLFLVIQRPLKELKMFIQIVINQVLLVIVDICVVILAIMDNMETDREDVRDRIGQGIIIIFYLSMASGIAFAASEVLFSIWGFYKFIKKLKAKGPLTVKRVLHALIHGIEEDDEIHIEGEKREKETRSTLDEQNVDISIGKRQLNQWKKLKRISQNRVRDSFQGWNNNNSEIGLANQNTDHSLSILPIDSERDLSPFQKLQNDYLAKNQKQISKSSSTDFSPVRAPRDIIPHLQSIIPRNTVKNHEQIPYNSQYSLDIFNNKPLQPIKAFEAQRKKAIRSAFESHDEMADSARRSLNNRPDPTPRMKVSQGISQAPWESQSHPQKRKNDVQKGKFKESIFN